METVGAQAMRSLASYRAKGGGGGSVVRAAADPKGGGELRFTILYDRQGRKVSALSGEHSYVEFEREITGLLKK
mgnify:CR=1 FL=1